MKREERKVKSAELKEERKRSVKREECRKKRER